MMIIWRGWGGAAIGYMVIFGALLGGALGAAALDSPYAGALAGLGVAIGGALGAVHGWYLNIVVPRKRADEWEAAQRPQIEAAADAGTLAVNNVQPSSPEEAAQMVEAVIDSGRRNVGQHGPHSVFWIPMEIVGGLGVVIGLGIAIASAISTAGA